MHIFLAGVSCVGKTTIGAALANLLQFRFFDLDAEVERFFGQPIERIQSDSLTRHGFRAKASQALRHVLRHNEACSSVVALPPSGLMSGYWPVISKAKDATIIVLRDTPENILARITFYDTDSRALERVLTDPEKLHYLREIRKDISYFGNSFRKAHASVDIAGCDVAQAARKVRDVLAAARASAQAQAVERCGH